MDIRMKYDPTIEQMSTKQMQLTFTEETTKKQLYSSIAQALVWVLNLLISQRGYITVSRNDIN